MIYEFYIIKLQSKLEVTSCRKLAEKPNLINALDRNSQQRLLRKYRYIPFPNNTETNECVNCY